MDVRSTGLPVLWLALAGFGCADRRPLTDVERPGPADRGGEVVDAATDGTANQDVPPALTSFQMIDDMDHLGDGPKPPPGSSAFFWDSPNTTGLGYWFATWRDGASSERTRDARIAVIDPPRAESRKACHENSTASGQNIDLWAQLDHPAGHPVDLSGYAGIAFWARLAGGGGKLVVAIDERSGGGYFRAQAGNSPLPAQTLAVSEQWQQFVLRFQDFGRQPAGVVSIDFVVAGDAEPFDLWIDDLALVCRGACP